MTVAAETTDLVVRSQTLDAETDRLASRGWNIVSRSETQAQLEKGKDTNHVLHLLLSLVTLGLWIPVWILVAIFGGRKTMLVSVRPDGQIVRRR